MSMAPYSGDAYEPDIGNDFSDASPYYVKQFQLSDSTTSPQDTSQSSAFADASIGSNAKAAISISGQLGGQSAAAPNTEVGAYADTRSEIDSYDYNSDTNSYDDVNSWNVSGSSNILMT